MEPTMADKRRMLNAELDYFDRLIPGREARQRSARAILRALAADPVMYDQIPFTTREIIHREAKGLPPVA